jgi:phage-related protein
VEAHFKPLEWIGTAYDDLAAFPEAARRRSGYQLWLVQTGRNPDDFKPMTDIGGGVYEIRIRTNGQHRVFYVAKFPEAVYVLHAFEKRTRKTAKRDLALAQRRYAHVVATRPR